MKVLLDTNIIVDDALERQPFLEASEQVLVLGIKGKFDRVGAIARSLEICRGGLGIILVILPENLVQNPPCTHAGAT